MRDRRGRRLELSSPIPSLLRPTAVQTSRNSLWRQREKRIICRQARYGGELRAMRAMTAILGGLKDVIFGRLTLFAIANLIVAGTITFFAAHAALDFVLPLIPDAEGLLGYASMAGSLLASVVVVVIALALSPAISMVVGGILFDFAAERVEKKIGAPKARQVPIQEGIANGARIALPALALNLIAIPL